MVKTRKNKKMIGGKDYYTQTTVNIKDEKTKDDVGMLKIPEYKDNEKLYKKTYGLYKMPPQNSNLGDEFESIVGNIYDSINYDPKKYEFETHVEFVPSPNAVKYNKIFGKFRNFLIQKKRQIANVLVVANDKFNIEHLMMDDKNGPHIYDLEKQDTESTSKEEEVVEVLHNYFELIKQIITKKHEPDKFTHNYNKDAVDVDETNIYGWSGGEMKVIEDSNNYENAIYIIGQVFGIIDPEFDGKLLNIGGARDISVLNKAFNASIFINLFKKLKKPVVAPPPLTSP